MISTKQNGTVSHKALILLAPDFREGTIVYCLERLRQAGVAVSLVGLSARMVKGLHGMVVRPDFSLGELISKMDTQSSGCADHPLIIIPGGNACISALFADPRVHQLIQSALQKEGLVAAMPEAEKMLEQTQLLTPETVSCFLWINRNELEECADLLIDYIDGQFA